MGGFIFRTGGRFKDWGERLRWDWLVRLGLGMKDFIFRHGVIEDGKIKFK
jgi:hypothetical protein